MIEYPIANPEIVFREELDEAILFNPNTGEIKLLNETGAFIYKLLDAKHSVEQIVDKLAKSFEIESREDALAEVREFIDSLQEKNLVGEEF